ncbi:MAG: hypothetical protein KDK36_08210 [Leptospiraceae bacterium]|nr:hypothetical protein [Leptospiraceae bacterium]
MSKVIQEKEFALLIEAYRKSLVRRYSEENLKNYPKFAKLDRKIIDKLVKYFLELLYPPHETRLELDNAFKSLGSFINTPAKFFGVMGNLGYAVIKFGKLLISAIHAGISALKGYLAAHKFESHLFESALPLIREGKDISDEKIFDSLIGTIPEEEATAFRKQVVRLFEILSEKELLLKIQEVMLHVIEKMEKKSKVYSKDEIKGIRMGYGIIESGKILFEELSLEEIKIILSGIDTIEKDYYEKAAGLKN